MMQFEMFRNRISQYIDEYMKDIVDSNKVNNYETLENHVNRLKKSWTPESDIVWRQITETFNEVCFIHYLVLTEKCRILYEPVGASRRSIDLKVEFNNKVIYFDIKTIHPKDINKWENFLIAKKEGRIDGEIDLFKDGLGGMFWHHMTASRGKFSDYAYDLEDKIRELNLKSYYYFMVFCGNGFDWRKDDLEDFVEFYKTGYYVTWDHLASMSKYDYKAKRISFDGSIHNFTMLKRKEFSKKYEIIPFVRMNEQFRTYIK